MKDIQQSVFIQLFKEACLQCFGHPLVAPLSETESKQLSNQILEKTGLVIGAKSIKNYSAFALQIDESHSENPSTATLDTLARYVLHAPYTDEVQRKNSESHHPYWFQYKEKVAKQSPKSELNPAGRNKILVAIGTLIFIALIIYFYIPKKSVTSDQINESFRNLSDDSLAQRGWMVQSKDTVFWKRRTEQQGYLTLFTLRGDNWPDSSQTREVKNLLLRPIHSECFTTEIHFKNFLPQQNWQQAGLLLLEDTAFLQKSLRISLAYNDFFGGFKRPKEILIQVITSNGKDDKLPEELAHQPLLLLEEETTNQAILSNLQNTALRIEKHGNRFRLLASNGSVENPAFKEIVSRELTLKPKFIGIFAVKGYVDAAEEIPVYIKSFRFTGTNCKD